MSDFKESNMVVQSNNLIQQTNWKLNAVPLKILKACISCINTTNPSNTVRLSKKDLMKFIDSEGSGNHAYLKKKCNDLITAVKAYDDEEREIYVALVQEVHWEKDSDYVSFVFSEKLMPFLVHLTSNFTQYQVANLNCFNSKYGLILYEYLLSSKRRDQQRFDFFIEVDSLRNLTATTKKYSTFDNFEKKVLKPALKDINENQLEILFDYEKVKEGRRIVGINFKVRFRNTYSENNFHVVKERKKIDDPLTHVKGDDVADGQTTIDDF